MCGGRGAEEEGGGEGGGGRANGSNFSASDFSVRCSVAGFALTANFRYFTGEDQHVPETKSAIGQTYWLLF